MCYFDEAYKPHANARNDCRKARPRSSMFMAEGADSRCGFSIPTAWSRSPFLSKSPRLCLTNTI